MVQFIVYIIIFTVLIWRNGFFGLLKDDRISNIHLAFLFLGKLAAIPVFYYVYEHFYGGLFNYDAGKFYEDLRVITAYSKTDPQFFLRFMFGLQNDQPGSADFQNVFINTNNWDNGAHPGFLYNDNRIVIRLHAFLDFFSFGSFFVHALFNCFLSFLGIFFLYRSIREYFVHKELYVFLILCFLPALWFYTGAPLKEGLCLFVLGGTVYNIKKLLQKEAGLKNVILALLFISLSFLLKPYLLLYSELCLTLFFILDRNAQRFKKIIFTSIICSLVIFLNFAADFLRGKSLLKAAVEHHNLFMDVAKGGIFLRDSNTFLRLQDDLNQIRSVGNGRYHLRQDIKYTYWKLDHVKDTLFSEANKDTLSEYQIVYHIPHSNSNINTGTIEGKNAPVLLASLYNSLFSPLFFNADSLLQMLASIENLLLIIALIVVLIFLILNKKSGLLPYVFIFMTLTLCLLIAFVAPNSGAIFRYRSPAVIFILLAAVYYLPLKNLSYRSKSSLE